MTEDDERYEQGWERLTRLNGTVDPRIVAQVREIAPDLADWIVSFGYGDAYDEGRLSARDRQLVTLGALAALGGCEPQVEVHARVARNVGLTSAEIVAALEHTVSYVGFPKAINALLAARQSIE